MCSRSRRSVAARGAGAGQLRRRRPVHRPHEGARRRASSAPAWSRMSRWPIRSARACPARRGGGEAAGGKVAPRRHLSGDGRPAILDPRRKPCSIANGAADVIGMTAMPEAKLVPRGGAALRAGRHGDRLRLLARRRSRASRSAQVIAADRRQWRRRRARWSRRCFAALPEARDPSPDRHVLDNALITAPEARDPALLAKLDAVAGRALG